MAETFVFVLAETVLGKLGSLAYDEVCLARGVKNDITWLADKLTTIKAVLLDAEEQQVHNYSLKLWLEKLKEVCYDAEDVLDEIEVEALRKQVVNQRGITKKVRHFFSSSNPLAFRFALGHKIKKIRERLAEIASDKATFGLTEKTEKKIVMGNERETHSFVLASDVIGRDEDKEKIIRLLMNPNDAANISVIPIVGLGGLGKTTVAKMVYNDKRVDESFDLKMWICVSDEFNIKKLIVDIIESATRQNYSNMKIEQLQRILRDTLNGKRYLLVMDDVWNEDSKLWIELRNLLLGGMYGSKIIVTTRSHNVVSIMGTIPVYNLGGLSLEECLSIFVTFAFRERKQKQYPNLMKIGEEIVKKCGGIPLAAKTLGSLLSSSTDERVWIKVRDDDIWKLEQRENDVLHALRLSYDHLPPYLKQCFAYYSVFPKDYPLFNNHLVYFWMAHGLLKSPGESQDLEDIGNWHLKELISRSFFQDIYQESYYDDYTFKMHDLMHDLASSLMKSECLIVKSNTQFCPKSVRHLSFADVNRPQLDLPSFLSNLVHARTILFPYDGVGPSQSFLESLISSFPFLRVLDLDYSNIEVLPKRIGNLKHLRYLNLSDNPKIKTLPNSICKLQSLQGLSIAGCCKLKELPEGIRYLISLRVFWVTIKSKCLPVNRIGCLKSLRELFIIACHNLEYLFDDIICLKSLQILRIGNCPNLITLPHGVKYLRSLKNLVLFNCQRLNLNLSMGTEGESNHQDFNSTRPYLQSLVVEVLPELVELPQWLLQLSTGTLQKLCIKDCSNFKALPQSMQNLQSLQYLEIRNCPNLSTLPEDMHYLSTLRELRIGRCCALSKRCEEGIGEDWPKIAHVPKIQIDGRWLKSSNY